jgi:hypothetical protein
VISEHYRAVAALIRPGIKVCLWEVDSEPDYPYVLLWGDLGDVVAENLADTVRDYELRIKATYVALNGDSLAGVAADVRSDLDRKRPVVEGWSVARLQVQALAAVESDESVSIPNYGHPLRAVDEVFVQSTRIV